ncbi:MAG: MarR family transcriptional regulator [Phyllobacteriaceae bacterium]|nr:MarR family transcriptional regulator [Phyllobacteriaceae bacterium]
MTDIISNPNLPDKEAVALVELLFFAYRDFVADPDSILEGLGFGRAHHRVLHFVGRDPGMTVAQLLDILRITKQSLSRVLKDLLEKGYVYQKAGEEDRRQRLLHLTEKGETLWRELSAPQTKRFRRAVADLEQGDATTYRNMLLQLINPENREAAETWISRTRRTTP